MREIVDGIGYVPKRCTWELTLRCNLACAHCGSSAGRSRADEMDEARSLRLVNELADLGCERLTLSGGEPTLSPHWGAIASEAARRGVSVSLITNGVTASRQLVRRARDAGLRSLAVSIDGPEAIHDRIRGRRGLFRQVNELLDDCAAEKLPVAVITTLLASNHRHLDEMEALLAGRVYAWQLQLGNGMGNLQRGEMLAPEDLLEVVPQVASLARRGRVPVRVADNLGYYGPYEPELRPRRRSPVDHWIGCYAGCRNLGVEANGGIKGCLSLQATDAVEGNVQREALADIWFREGAFRCTRQFELSDLTGFCATCEHAAVCRGGCFSMRTCEGGTENPYCYHRVATLAERRRERSRARYVPMVLAPAAILTAFGCAGRQSHDADVTAEYMVPDVVGQDEYGVPEYVEPSSDDNLTAQPEYGAPDYDPDATSEYAVVEPEPDVGEEYAAPDPDMSIEYDAPEPDTVVEYGVPF